MELFFTSKTLCFSGRPQELAAYLQDICLKYDKFSDLLRVNLH